MQIESINQYYAREDKITSLGAFSKNIPKPMDIIQACDLVNNLILIDIFVSMKRIKVPESFRHDVNVRTIEEKLDILSKRSHSDFNMPRNHNEKMLGNCRDTSLLLCAILRSNGIPARVRSGFATFFTPKKKFDHWLCEYWDQDKSVWIKVDSWMYQIKHHKALLPFFFRIGLKKLSYTPLDVAEKHFIPGGQAWINCELKGDDSNKYGTEDKKRRGMWFVRDNMLRDILCLNKIELLPWECRGIICGKKGEMSKEDRENLLYIANLSLDIGSNFDKIKQYFQENEGLHC